jgi:hypothetical protein
VIRLYHPELGTEIEAESPEQAAVYAQSGWVEAPDPPPAAPGFVAEPTRYEQGEDGVYHPVLPLAAAKAALVEVKAAVEKTAKVRRTNKPADSAEPAGS